MIHSKLVRLKTAPTGPGGESVHLFLESTINVPNTGLVHEIFGKCLPQFFNKIGLN